MTQSEYPGPDEVISQFRERWRLDFPRVERVLTGITRADLDISGLVRHSGVDRHDVEEVVRSLQPWITVRDGRYSWAFPEAPPTPARPAPAWSRNQLVRELIELRRGLPAPVKDLDHVSATAETMADRALHFADLFALDDATVLLVGDHDLTSLALTLLVPSCAALVVDVDHRLLAYIAEAARARGLAVTVAFADLRLGLPPAYEGRADLAFTDPPYSPEGISLFVARGLAGLRRTGHERVAFAYGYADHQLTRGFRTQSALHDLRLVMEAVWPRFNRFDGAEAIGCAADLYVCRPTRWTWPVLEKTGPGPTRIYTRGAAAEEATPVSLPEAVVREVVEIAAGESSVLRVYGDGWPADGSAVTVQTLGEFLAEGAADRTDSRGGVSVLPVVVLHPYLDTSLVSALLAAPRWPQACLVASRRRVSALLGTDGNLRWLLETVLSLEVRHVTPDVTLVMVKQRPRRKADVDAPGTRLLTRLLGRPHQKLLNAWREGLIDAARKVGTTLTKNQAREAIADVIGPRVGLGELRLLDLPLCDLVDLPLLVDRSLEPVLRASGSPTNVARAH